MDLSYSSSGATPTRNTLLREGVLPATLRVVPGSSFGRGTGSSLRGSDQQQERRRKSAVVPAGRLYTPLDPITSSPYLTLPRAEWINLGEGWFQATPVRETGANSSKCGLHSVIDGTAGLPFLCIYEPRSAEAIASCIHSSEYDLEVSAKIVAVRPTLRPASSSSRRPSLMLSEASSSSSSSSPSLSAAASNFQIIFAFQSFFDFLIVTCDVPTQSWILSRVRNGEETVLEQVCTNDIKPNLFYNVLIQVRGNFVSLDVNNAPVITGVRVAAGDESQLGGFLGVLSRGGSKFAIKGWRLRCVGSGSHAVSGGGSVSGGGLVIRAPIFPLSTAAQAAAPRATKTTEAAPEVDIEEDACLRLLTPADLAYINESPLHRPAPHPPIAAPERESSNKENRGEKKKVMSLAEMMAARTAPQQQQQQHESTILSSTAPAPMAAPPAPPSSSSSVSGMLKRLGGPLLVGAPLGGGGPGGAAQSLRASLPPTTTTISATAGGGGAIVGGGDLVIASAAANLYQSHERGIVDTVVRDVVQRDLGISFDDIAALDDAKRLLTEAVVLPLMVPELFTGIREPWKGVLLYGPPGTGKTLLAKAVCSLNQSTFFNCPSSSLVSKYRGESEKIVRCLFEAARLLAPAVVFLDEVDALVGVRGEGEHEASRRLKTEIFSQMDGISSTNKASREVT